MSRLQYTFAMLAAGGAAVAAGEAAASPPVTVTLDIPIDTSGNVVLTPITLAGASAPQFYYATVTEPAGTADQVEYGVPATDTLEISALLQADYVSSNSSEGFEGTPYTDSAVGMKASTPGLPSLRESYYESATAPYPLQYVYKVDETTGDSYVSYMQSVLAAEEAGATKGPTYSPVSASDVYLHVAFDPALPNGGYYIGTFFIDTSGELESITYTAYSAAPEPDAWALLVAGAAFAGGAARARRRRLAPAA